MLRRKNVSVPWGVYNGWVDTTLFPLQICEATTAVLIAAVTALVVSRNNYDTGNKAMPIAYIIFGLTRFGWEFLRDNHKLFLGISELALWALAAAVLGVAWLILLKKKQNDQTNIDANIAS